DRARLFSRHTRAVCRPVCGLLSGTGAGLRAAPGGGWGRILGDGPTIAPGPAALGVARRIVAAGTGGPGDRPRLRSVAGPLPRPGRTGWPPGLPAFLAVSAGQRPGPDVRLRPRPASELGLHDHQHPVADAGLRGRLATDVARLGAAAGGRADHLVDRQGT